MSRLTECLEELDRARAIVKELQQHATVRGTAGRKVEALAEHVQRAHGYVLDMDLRARRKASKRS